jgi:hypothetical protein
MDRDLTVRSSYDHLRTSSYYYSFSLSGTTGQCLFSSSSSSNPQSGLASPRLIPATSRLTSFRLVFNPASVASFQHSSPQFLHFGTAHLISALQQVCHTCIATEVVPTRTVQTLSTSEEAVSLLHKTSWTLLQLL